MIFINYNIRIQWNLFDQKFYQMQASDSDSNQSDPGIFQYNNIYDCENEQSTTIIRHYVFIYYKDFENPHKIEYEKQLIPKKIETIFDELKIEERKRYKIVKGIRFQDYDNKKKYFKDMKVLSLDNTFQEEKIQYEDQLFCVQNQNENILQKINSSYINSTKSEIKLIIKNNSKYMNILAIDSVKDLLDEGILNQNHILIQSTLNYKIQKGGKVITKFSQSSTDKFYCIDNKNPISLIHQLGQTKLQDINSPPFLYQFQIKQGKGINFKQALEKVKQFQIIKPKLKKFYQKHKILTFPLVSVPYWTTDLIYRDINKQLMSLNLSQKFKKYLKYFEEGLKLLPNESLTVYRGLSRYKNRKIQVNKTIFWANINSTSANRKTAELFCRIRSPDERKQLESTKKATLYQIKAHTAKNINHLSVYQEQQYILRPFTLYRITKIEFNENTYDFIKLQQIPSPRQTNIIIWFNKIRQLIKAQDDIKQHQLLSIMYEVKKQYSVLPIHSHIEGQSIINNFNFILQREYFNLKIIIDFKQKYAEKSMNSCFSGKQKKPHLESIRAELEKQIFPFINFLQSKNFQESILILTNDNEQKQLYRKLFKQKYSKVESEQFQFECTLQSINQYTDFKNKKNKNKNCQLM